MSLESVTQAVRTRIEAGDSGLGATVLFDFGEDGVLLIDGVSDPNVVGNDTGDADCTIAISIDDFESLLSGDLDPTTAFMMGKLKVDGDMGIAMKLSSVF